MFCKKCGKQLMNDDEFCSKCGYPTAINDILSKKTQQQNSINMNQNMQINNEKIKSSKTNSKMIIIILLIVIPIALIAMGGLVFLVLKTNETGYSTKLNKEVSYGGYNIKVPDEFNYSITEKGLEINNNYTHFLIKSEAATYEQLVNSALSQNPQLNRQYCEKAYNDRNIFVVSARQEDKNSVTYIYDTKNNNVLWGVIANSDWSEIPEESIVMLTKILRNAKYTGNNFFEDDQTKESYEDYLKKYDKIESYQEK